MQHYWEVNDWQTVPKALMKSYILRYPNRTTAFVIVRKRRLTWSKGAKAGKTLHCSKKAGWGKGDKWSLVWVAGTSSVVKRHRENQRSDSLHFCNTFDRINILLTSFGLKLCHRTKLIIFQLLVGKFWQWCNESPKI